MAENIDKVFPKGAWYHDTRKQRYDHVMVVLDRYLSGEYDINDVRWFIKNALTNRIYVSKEVKALWNKQWCNTNKRQKEIWNQICQNGYADDKCMDIRKYTGGYRFEHIVPSNVFIDRLIQLASNQQLDFNRFEQIRSKINVCIITKKENDKLDKNGFRQKMPNGIDFETGDEFARYKDPNVLIDIYRPNTSNCSCP